MGFVARIKRKMRLIRPTRIIIIVLLSLASCNPASKTAPQRAGFLEGAPNFRDLGGYVAGNRQTVWRKLFRSQELSQLTDADLAILREIGVKTVVDFRTDNEVHTAKSRLPEGVKIIRIPIAVDNVAANDTTPSIMERIMTGDADILQAIDYMEQMNRILVNNFALQYRDFFKILLQADAYPIVFHCSAGKDRTGFAAALVLTSLGVDWDTVVEDYMLTNTYFKPSISSRVAPQAMPAMQQLLSVRESYIFAAHNEIMAQYGSMDNFLQYALDIGETEKNALKKYMLN